MSKKGVVVEQRSVLPKIADEKVLRIGIDWIGIDSWILSRLLSWNLPRNHHFIIYLAQLSIILKDSVSILFDYTL